MGLVRLWRESGTGEGVEGVGLVRVRVEGKWDW